MYNVLICDDERDIVNALKIYLGNEGYNLIEAFNGKDALEIINKEEVHLILMDIMMPIMDGMEATLKIREISNAPVIFLTAKGEDMDKIMGLSIGADDYITKPFNPLEVVARTKSQLRRYTLLGSVKPSSDLLIAGGLELNYKKKEVVLDGEEVFLTPLELEVLKLLMEGKGQVFSPKEIYSKVWGDCLVGSENTVAVHIRHLREKIEINPKEPRYIKVVWGQGYKIEEGDFYEK